ncbi:MAG: hypothetical protein DCF22_02350 [Leptolyngbya sp.]|nr:MAG: hypothetical protein DCF22_02350 [Leptolyngbya sp.]
MTTKERLIQELEHAPEELLEAVLNFVMITKTHQAHQLNDSMLVTEDTTEKTDGIASLLAMAERFAAELTEEELAQLPRDGALEHDHYIYGTPKRYSRETAE